MEEEVAREQGHYMQGFWPWDNSNHRFEQWPTNIYGWDMLWHVWVCKESYSYFGKSVRVSKSFRLSDIKIRGAIYFKLAFNYSLVLGQHPKVCSITQRLPKGMQHHQKENSLWAVCRSMASQSLLQIGLTEYSIGGHNSSMNEVVLTSLIPRPWPSFPSLAVQ